MFEGIGGVLFMGCAGHTKGILSPEPLFEGLNPSRGGHHDLARVRVAEAQNPPSLLYYLVVQASACTIGRSEQDHKVKYSSRQASHQCVK